MLNIRRHILRTISMTVILLLWAGCAHQKTASVYDAQLPEEIFSSPGETFCAGARVAIFAFSSPDYAIDKGSVAGRLLCDALEQTGVFEQVVFEPDISDMTMRNLIDIARIKRYDLIVTGKLTYYLAGSYVGPSSVTESIRVVRVRGGRPELLWHARASEESSPVQSVDLIFFETDASPARSPYTLMRRNADKFAKMMLTLPPIQ